MPPSLSPTDGSGLDNDNSKKLLIINTALLLKQRHVVAYPARGLGEISIGAVDVIISAVADGAH